MAGTSFKYIQGYVFRTKSSEGWARGHGLLPKNTVTELLKNLRISMSNRSRVKWARNPRLFTVQTKNGKLAPLISAVSDDESVFSQDQAGRMGGGGFCCLTCLPQAQCCGFVRAWCEHPWLGGSFLPCDWPYFIPPPPCDEGAGF